METQKNKNDVSSPPDITPYRLVYRYRHFGVVRWLHLEDISVERTGVCHQAVVRTRDLVQQARLSTNDISIFILH
jgi:hypothetical protein